MDKNKLYKQFDPDTEDDRCPVCRAHPETLGYSMLTSGSVMMLMCETCGVVYVPLSIRNVLKALKEKAESRIIPAHGAVPGIMSNKV